MKVANASDKATYMMVTQAAALAEAEAKHNFSGAHAKGEPHTGGNRPNIVTGTLRRSIRADPVRRLGFQEWGTHVGPRVIYGRRVELGYDRGGRGPGHQRTRPFPYFGPGVESARAQYAALVVRIWRQFI